jgi:signal transduction histidine kinase/CheY-like chemotaxis protein
MRWLPPSLAGVAAGAVFGLGGLLSAGPASGAGLATAGILALVMHAWQQRRVMAEMQLLLAEERRVSRALRLERDRAADSSASKTRLFAAASHDLRQPLHALSINATTLQLVAGRQDDPVIRELSLSINRALTRSNGLLDSLLDLSRFDARAIRSRPEAVDAGMLVQAICEQFRPSAAERGLEIRAVLPAPGSAPLQIHVDLTLMLRVLGNLVSNAVKFTEQGSIVVSVWEAPAEHESADSVLIEVSDTGRGIGAGELPHIFEEFYQANPSQREEDGSLGLGLSIVKRAADLMGIVVEVKSQLGEGTVVLLRCPRRPSGEAGAQHEAASAPEPGFKFDAASEPLVIDSGEPVRVLLIEDEKAICESLQTFLPYLGFEIRSASNSGEALAIVASGFKPTVLVIDQLLRKETGFAAAQRLVRVLGAMPAVMVTGDTDFATREQACAQGLRLVHKPVEGMRLVQILREVQRESGHGPRPPQMVKS